MAFYEDWGFWRAVMEAVAVILAFFGGKKLARKVAQKEVEKSGQ